MIARGSHAPGWGQHQRRTPGSPTPGLPVAPWDRARRSPIVAAPASLTRSERADAPPRPTLLERHGRRMARGRWVVIPLFLVLLVGAFSSADASAEVISSEQSLPGSEAQRGIELVQTELLRWTREHRRPAGVPQRLPHGRRPRLPPGGRGRPGARRRRGAGHARRVVLRHRQPGHGRRRRAPHVRDAARLPSATRRPPAGSTPIRAAVGTPAGFAARRSSAARRRCGTTRRTASRRTWRGPS